MVRQQGDPNVDYNAKSFSVDGNGMYRLCCLDCDAENALEDCLVCFGANGILSTNQTSNIWTTDAVHILDVDTYVPTVYNDPNVYQYLTGPDITGGRYLTHTMPDFINISLLYSTLVNRYWYFNPGLTIVHTYDIQYLDGNGDTKYVPVGVWFKGEGLRCVGDAVEATVDGGSREIRLWYSGTRFDTPNQGPTNLNWSAITGDQNRIKYITSVAGDEYVEPCAQTLSYSIDTSSPYGGFPGGTNGWQTSGVFTFSVNP